MVPLVEQRLDAIRDLCRKHGVRTLVLFGSASRGDDFDTEKSDVDFVVDFVDYDSPTLADQYFGLHEQLEALLGRKVDLATHRTIRKRFERYIDPRPQTLYAA
jgi:predicted nucleotidyltransferase